MPSKNDSSLKLILIAVLSVLAWCSTVHAKVNYVPQSIYSYEQVQFDNGFQAILNAREGAPYVSMRLVVATGSGDFDCANRQLPHLVEHLMFSGTSGYTEADLEELVDKLGGSWNAQTAWDKTIYEMDIFSGNVQRGIEIFYAIFTDTDISNEDLAMAREIVYLEDGGKPSAFDQFLFKRGITKGSADRAYRKFVPESRYHCEHIPTLDHIHAQDIDRYRVEHHVPGNMIFIATGDFDANKLKAVLADTFAKLPDGPRPEKKATMIGASGPRQRVEYVTRFEPIMSKTTYVGLEFQVTSEHGPERAATFLLANYLHQRLYEELRLNRGLAYGPEVSILDHGDFITMELSADADNRNANAALGIMEELVTRVAAEGIGEQQLELEKQSELYRISKLFEGNDTYTLLYANFADRLIAGRGLPTIQADIEAIDVQLVRKIATERLRMDRAMVFVAAPTILRHHLVIVLLILVSSLGWFGWRRYRKRRVT